MTRIIQLECDEEDWDTIQTEFARMQSVRDDKGMYSIPEGDSNLAGAMVAELIRGIIEYRNMFHAERP